MPIALAGNEQGTVLDRACNALLPLFTTAEACALRLVSQDFLAAVRKFPWDDKKTVIKGSIGAWHACFPHARAANLSHSNVYEAPSPAGLRAAGIPLEHIHYLSELRHLYVRGNPSFTDEALLRLGGSVQHLDIRGCMNLSGNHMERMAGAALVRMDFCRKAAFDAALAKGVKAVWTAAPGLCHICGLKRAQSVARGADGTPCCSKECRHAGMHN